MYKDDLVHEFNDEMWYLYHEGTINNAEEFQRDKHIWIKNKTNHRNDCKEICGELNYDVFGYHELTGHPKSWEEAASNALYDLLNEHNDALTFNKMRIQNE